MNVLATPRQSPSWLPPGLVYDEIWDETRWVGPPITESLAQDALWFGCMVFLCCIALIFKAPASASRQRTLSLAAATTAALIGWCFPFLDDGDGDIAGNLIAWSVGAYAVFGCWMALRSTPQRPIWWLVDPLLHGSFLYTMWVNPLIISVSDAWYAAPWILGWYFVQWASARRRGRHPEGQDPGAVAWRRLSTTLLCLLCPGALLLALGGGKSGEGTLLLASWLLNLPALLLAMTLPIFALAQLFAARNAPRSSPRLTDRIVVWRRQN